jgi:ATP-dependent Clp protease ATP-binding subunit ClpA
VNCMLVFEFLKWCVTWFAYRLAQRIVKGDVPEPLRKCKVMCVGSSDVT